MKTKNQSGGLWGRDDEASEEIEVGTKISTAVVAKTRVIKTLTLLRILEVEHLCGAPAGAYFGVPTAEERTALAES